MVKEDLGVIAEFVSADSPHRWIKMSEGLVDLNSTEFDLLVRIFNKMKADTRFSDAGLAMKLVFPEDKMGYLVDVVMGSKKVEDEGVFEEGGPVRLAVKELLSGGGQKISDKQLAEVFDPLLAVFVRPA